jgi:hypothetical protein
MTMRLLKLHTSDQLSRRRKEKNQNRNRSATKEENDMALERAWQTMWKSTTNLNGAITLTRIVPQSGLQAFSNAPHTRSAPQSGSKGSGGVSSYLRLPAQSGFSSATVHPSQLRMPSRSGSHSIAVGVSPVRHLAALPLMVHQNV